MRGSVMDEENGGWGPTGWRTILFSDIDPGLRSAGSGLIVLLRTHLLQRATVKVLLPAISPNDAYDATLHEPAESLEQLRASAEKLISETVRRLHTKPDGSKSQMVVAHLTREQSCYLHALIRGVTQLPGMLARLKEFDLEEVDGIVCKLAPNTPDSCMARVISIAELLRTLRDSWSIDTDSVCSAHC